MAADAHRGGEPERLDGQRVSARYFHVLGVQPALGRDFEASDDRAQRSRVVIMSHGALAAPLRRRSARSSAARSCSTTTLLRRHRRHARRASRTSSRRRQRLWAPLQYDPSLPPTAGNGAITCAWSAASARRRHRARRAGARHDCGAPLAELPRPPWAALADGLIVHSLQDEVTRDVRAGAARGPRRGAPAAGDRLRERHESAARPRRRAPRRIRDACRARSGRRGWSGSC